MNAKPSTILKTAAIAMLIGSICPWATLLGVASASGVAVRFGWVTALAGAIILTAEANPGWLGRRPKLQARRRQLAVWAAVCAAVCCVLVILGASQTEYGAALHASWGCYLTLAASVCAGIYARRVLPRAAQEARQ